ncbi:hypothetical protein Ctaglu_46060 [Clostridium tagluense]|uniref:Uncharacterized protein n=1 Tax=Clostridium tagluense TaxID=360422 RepID=A0A401UTW4_9CLOT|nr:hypothetical protein Ctaglu_46060 [Clostridium tagluense]
MSSFSGLSVPIIGSLFPPKYSLFASIHCLSVGKIFINKKYTKATRFLFVITAGNLNSIL